MATSGVDVIRDQAKMVADLLGQSFAGVTSEQATWHQEGSKANAIGPTYIHAHLTEDRFISGRRGRPTIFESEGWQERLSFDPTQPWSEQQVTDVDACRAYAAEVGAQTQAYLSDLDPSTLGDTISMGAFGNQPLSFGLSLTTVLHKMLHFGEISALLGEQGEKGFPF